MAKVKFLILLAVVAIAAAAPSKTIKEESMEIYREIMTKQIRKTSLLARFKGPSESDFAIYEEPTFIQELNTDTFRLPNNTIPLHYNVRITTNIHEGDFNFQGVAMIKIKVLEPSSSITMHSISMDINQINIYNVDMEVIEENVDLDTNGTRQFLVISLKQQLQADQDVFVRVEYSSGLRNDRQGFYQTTIRDPETSEQSWVATTLFEPIFARHAFPCYDEIRFRTSFDISIVHHSSYNAVSNMPISKKLVSGTSTTTTFQTTPPMPTYNVAFTVTNFGFISNNDRKLPMRVYAPSADIESGRAEGSLEIAGKVWEALEGYFGIPYPLPKSDMLAVENWRNGEAWGLINIDEEILLQTDESNRMRRMQIAHEYSHTYFSNLVSPLDWSYLWLNEGFATLYENVINDIAFPDTQNWAQFLIDTFDLVVDFDASGWMTFLNSYAESPAQIEQKFNFVTYSKGAVILRMLKDAISEEIFIQGVKFYLDEMEYKSAEPEDLYRNLQKAYDIVHPGNNVKINELMDTWTNFEGLPVVTVSRSNNGLLLTQSGFGATGDRLFSIPINYATASDRNFDNATAEFWMTTKEHEITREDAGKTWTDSDWVIFNLRDTGYYVTNYDETLWELITSSLADHHEDINYLNRGTLFADIFRFIQQNSDFKVTIFLDIVETLKLEHHHHVWIRARNGLDVFETRLRGLETHSMYMNFLKGVMTDIYGRDFEDSWATFIVNFFSCLSGVQACNDDASQMLIDVMENEGTEFPSEVRCNAFRTANETIWMHFFNLAMSQPSGPRRSQELFFLKCTQNPTLINHALNTAIDTTNNLGMFERSELIETMAWENLAGYNAVIEFIEINHEALNEILGNGFLRTMLSFLSSLTNTECQAEKVLGLVKFMTDPERHAADRASLRRAMEPNLNFVLRNSENIHEWLETHSRN